MVRIGNLHINWGFRFFYLPFGVLRRVFMQDASFWEILLSTIFILLYSITIIGLIVVIIAENRNPLKTIPWVVVLLLAPGVGILFYFFFGQDNRKQRIISRKTYKRIIKQHKSKRFCINNVLWFGCSK